jgi:NAD+ diphosphatase
VIRVTAVFIPLVAPPDTPAVSSTRWFCVRGAEVLVADHPPAGADEPHFLGMLDTVAGWAVDVDGPDGGADVDGYQDLRRLFGQVSDVEWTVAGRAVQIVEWGRTHRFCGRCGTATVRTDNDRSMTCPACKLLAYPRLAPAVITLITRGDEALLARGRNFPLPMYSCVAGFVEPGETLEQAVEREVREEVGIAITDVRYVGSQPWPFPHSLMLGYRAEWAAGEIVIDETEIADAKWFRRDELPMIPPPISIARSLIDGWLLS